MKNEEQKVKKSILYNSIGSFVYLFCQWLMTFIVVWVSGYNAAGILSISMSVATTYAVIATFNMRNYQASDLKGKYSEKTYLTTRLITCIIALVITFIYSLIHEFSVFQILCINIFMIYKLSEAIVDVLHGTLQKKWRFDIIGISFFARGLILITLFFLGLKLTDNLLIALLLVTIGTYLFIIFYDIKKYRENVNNYGNYKKSYTFKLLVQCVPMVIYGLIFSYVSLYPKVYVENIFGSELVGYYSSVATPALIIQVAATFVFNPLISLFAEYYNNKEYKKFNYSTFRVLGIIVLIGFLGLIASKYLGRWGLELLYGSSILDYVYLFNGVIIISTLTAIIWFLGMLLVVKRNYKVLIFGSLISLIVTFAITKNMIQTYGLEGINITLIIVYLVQIVIYLYGVLKKDKIDDNNKIYYLRSTSIINDSRASKEITSLINNNYQVKVLGWDRDNRINDNVLINGNEIESKFFKYRTNYGGSIKTIIGIFLYQVWILFNLIKDSNKYKCIHACDFDCGFIANIVASVYNKKLVYDIYDYYTDSRPMPKKVENIVNGLENNIINNADLTIICGEWRKKQIKDTSPKDLIVIHNTPDIRNIDNLDIIKSKSKKIKIVYVGILQSDRLIMEVVNAIKGNSKYELHIGGFGPYEKDIKKISENYDNVFFYGSLKYNEVLALESKCDILFATYDPKIRNHKFSAPNKVYEAMALSKPIIVCNNTGIDSIIKDNDIGLTIDYSGDDFMNCLDNIRNDKKRIKEMGMRANKLYIEKYSWSKMESKLINEYDKIIKEEAMR